MMAAPPPHPPRSGWPCYRRADELSRLRFLHPAQGLVYPALAVYFLVEIITLSGAKRSVTDVESACPGARSGPLEGHTPVTD